GYYKDATKTAKTFPVIDGTRYAVPGDHAQIRADGTLIVLGRGSVCINSGGEKIYPEEVEQVLRKHEDVADAVVVGTPNERFGEQVTAVVQARAGTTIDPARDRVRRRDGAEPFGQAGLPLGEDVRDERRRLKSRFDPPRAQRAAERE